MSDNPAPQDENGYRLRSKSLRSLAFGIYKVAYEDQRAMSTDERRKFNELCNQAQALNRLASAADAGSGTRSLIDEPNEYIERLKAEFDKFMNCGIVWSDYRVLRKGEETDIRQMLENFWMLGVEKDRELQREIECTSAA